MYWLGDSKWGWQFNFRRFPGEFIQGLIDNIPPCCVVYYTFVKAVCLLVHGPYNSLGPDPSLGLPHKPSNRCKDFMLFSMFYDLKRKRGGKSHSDDFQKLDYWRCPFCRLIDKRNKLDWTTKAKWDYKRFW